MSHTPTATTPEPADFVLAVHEPTGGCADDHHHARLGHRLDRDIRRSSSVARLSGDPRRGRSRRPGGSSPSPTGLLAEAHESARAHRVRRARQGHRSLARRLPRLRGQATSRPGRASTRSSAEPPSDNGLPRINTFVDLYNAISILHRVPIGGEDLDRYDGPPRLVLATGDEPFHTNADGEPVVDHADPGEPVWLDDAA